MYYGNASADEVMFGSELRRLADAGQLDLHEFTGKTLLDDLRPEDFEEAAAYICGPAAMNRAVADKLGNLGFLLNPFMESYGQSASASTQGRVHWKRLFGRNRK